MHSNLYQVIDANINRVSEGLRVIEDYTRFISKNKSQATQLARIRKEINQTEINKALHLASRNVSEDMRAGELPQKRVELFDLLKANFKRAEEGLRVLEEYTGNPIFNKARYELYILEKDIILGALKAPINPGVYLISDDPEILLQGIKWQVSVIQLRDKLSPKHIVLEKAKTIQPKAKKAGVTFIVNDYLDIALLSDADGLHVGQEDIDTPSIRKLLGPHKIIGRSTHSLEEGLEAQKAGADYLGIGPIWSTISKPERSPIGLDYLKQAKKKITIPYTAIGDVNLKHMADLAVAKPPMVAVIRAWKEIPEIQKLMQKW